MTFPEAIEYLARRASIPIPEPEANSPRAPQQRSARDLALKLNLLAAEHFHQKLMSLPTQHPANQYRLKRGLSDELCKEFMLGYAPDSWDDLSLKIERAGLPLSLAEKIGLVRSRGQGKSGVYDFFRDRLMFPIFTAVGDVMAFGGRIFGDGQPKYLNSPETPLFSKGKSFYLLDKAVKHIRSEDHVIVVEGYMDALAMHKHGFKNTVAVLGTALTREHAKVLKRHTNKVILFFDSDKAGKSAARASLPVLLSEGLFVHGLSLEQGKDPDEFLAGPQGPEQLKDLLAKVPEMFYVVLKERLQDYQGSASDKVTVVDDLSDILKQMSDPRLKSLYVRDLAEKLQVAPSWVTRALVDPAAVHGPHAPKAAPGKQPNVAPPLGSSPGANMAQEAPKPIKTLIRVEKGVRKAEVALLNLALKSRQCMDEILLGDIVRQLSSPAVREILQCALDLYRHKPEDFDKLTALLAEKVEPRNIVTRHLEPEFAAGGDAEDRKLLQDCYQNIQENFLKSQAQALAKNLNQQTSEGELEQFMNIAKARNALRKDH